MRPLADLIRPKSIEEVVGQDHLLGEMGPIHSQIRSGKIGSCVLWGPPGVGKTTIARILAENSGLGFVQISAVYSNTAELKKIFAKASADWEKGVGTVLFVDEIHRFNKAQQDGFLPYVENGTVVLIGSTTENPSFELNPALLSRTQVLVLSRLSFANLEVLLKRAEENLGKELLLGDGAKDMLLHMADGDGRNLINSIELLHSFNLTEPIGPSELSKRLSRRAAAYDKSRDWHYNLISALHKSVRGSDPDAALYWLARMLDAGEDPRFLARRIARMSVEDIGLADPDALGICLDSWEAYERLGSPEGELAIAQAVIYLALAPKSNSAYRAHGKALKVARSSGSLAPPMHILNAPTKLMSGLGYGKGYRYDHDEDSGFSGQRYFPDKLERQQFYHPVERGYERTLGKRLKYFERLRSRSGRKGLA